MASSISNNGRVRGVGVMLAALGEYWDTMLGTTTTAARVQLRTPWKWHLCRRFILGVICSATLVLTCWLAFQVRFDFNVPEQYQTQMRHHWAWVVGVQLACLYLFGQFSGIYRYFSLPDARRLGLAIGVAGLALYLVQYVPGLEVTFPRGVLLVQMMLSFLALGILRCSWRIVHEKHFHNFQKGRTSACERRVAIVGAGDAGASLLRQLCAQPRLGMLPVAFFDDDRRKWKTKIHGVPVVGNLEQIHRYQDRYQFSEVVVAMPSAPTKRLAEVAALVQKHGLKCATVPGLDQLTSGRYSLSQLRPVAIEDLLGRQPIDLHLEQIAGVLQGRVVMVTGAGGSIGSELCRQVAAFKPKRLLLVEQSEVQLFQIEQELRKLGWGDIISPLIADILDQPRMASVFSSCKPDVIFHAAAHKHVSMMEVQPCEAIKNNAFGTAFLAELALEYGVERFVMISTDKAVNPTSVMGATKRLAEIFLEALAHANPRGTRFSAVRFGNVLGSSGSVVPIFEKQIAEGGPVTVTDPNVVRFFMTIPEAVGLVLQSCAQGNGGEVFILDMGKAVKIADLARQMIRLSGLEPDRDIQIKYIGLRPGEKLYEELHHLQANCGDTRHPRIKKLTSVPAPLERVRNAFKALDADLDNASPDELKRALKRIIPEYVPHLQGPKQPAVVNSSVRQLSTPKNCPRLRAGNKSPMPEELCEHCTSFRLCVWQYGWDDDTSAAAHPVQREHPSTIGL